MNQFLYDVAEAAYVVYDKAKEIKPELLYAWLSAEVHFAREYATNLDTTLGDLPETNAVKVLWHTQAMGYREFRHTLCRERASFTQEVRVQKPPIQ
jgi:hypothetical protein